MPRVKKTSEDEAEPKPVRRTRRTSVITDSPVRRSTRNKPLIADSSPESIIESQSVVKKVTRKRTPTPDLELSQTTRTLRKRNIKSESGTPSTPPVARVTRRTRATSVAVETSKSQSKRSIRTPVKERRRLASVPIEPSLVEEDKDDFASEKSSDDKQNSSHESSEKTDDDQLQESTSSKEEIEESTIAPVEEDSIIIIEEVNGVKSVIKKKEKYTGIEKRLMNRMLACKLNYSNNENLNGSEINEVPELELKNERRSSKEEVQVANLENHEVSEKEDLQENMEIEEEVVKEKTPGKSSARKSSLGKKNSKEEEESFDIKEKEEVVREKSPRKSSGRKSSLEKKSSGKEDESNGFNNGESSNEISDEGESPIEKEKTPYKEKTPLIGKSPLKEKTPNKNQTPIKNQTPNKIPTPHKSKTPKKNPTSSKRFSNEAPVDEDTDLIDKSKNEDYLPEPMEVDISDPQINDFNYEIDIETIAVPERMSRDFKPRKSMIEIASEKILVSKDRSSLGNKKPECIDFSIQKEKRRRKSNGIDAESDDFESKSLIKDIPSENSSDQTSSYEKRSLEKRKSISENRNSLTSEKRKSSSEKRDSYSLSDRPASFQLQVTPEKDELSNSEEKMLISNLSKSSEKNSRKRKRESSETDESYQLSVVENEEESFTEKNEFDITLTEENTDEDIETPRNRKSLTKRRSKSNANEFAKESESGEKDEKKTPKSLRKKRLLKEFKEEDAAEGKKKTPKKDKSLMSMSLEEGEISNSEAENVNSEDEEELLKSDQESFVKNEKRRSKSKSFEGTETKMEEKEISKNRKSLDNNRSMSSSLEYGTEFEAKAESSIEKSSGKKENKEESESEDDKRNKPVMKNIEILQDNDSNNSLVQRLKDNYEEKLALEKTPKKLNKSQTDEKKLTDFEATGESDSSKDELTDEDSVETVKRTRKSKSIGTTPSLSPISKLNKLKDLERNGKKSNIGKKNKEDSPDVSSKIPFFMYSQTSSENESEDDEEGSAEEASKSIDSDIAREYNLDGRTISRYSDDDVPADNCRASESEHSDSDDNGSDLADFVVDGSEEDEEDEEEIEDEEESDDSVFDHESEKSREISRPEVVLKKLVHNSKEENDDGEEEEEEKEAEEEEELLKEPSPSKFTETRRSRNSSSKLANTDEENEIKEQEIQIQQHEVQTQQLEVQIHDQEKQLGELEVQNQDLEIQDREEKKSPEKVDKLMVNLCSDSESQNSVNKTKNTKMSKKLKKKKGKEESKTENQSGNSEKQKNKNDVEVEETRKNKKSKRELKATESKTPVASSTRYEATSESEEEPETLSFADARNKVLEANKKKSENLKAGKGSKRKKKTGKEEKKIEEAKVEVNSGNIKRLPDELIDDLEDVPRPKKRQKVSKKNDFETPSLGMHDRRYSFPSKSKSLISASECGSTTDFQVVSIQPKEKKQKTQSSLALKWFKQRMIARNIRQPISVYLSQQQKRRAAGKDHF